MDWADELARQIERDLKFPGALALVAVRLRLVREEGIGDGIERVRKVTEKIFKPQGLPQC